MTVRRSIAQERVSKGQCPRCGKEAAPYYLCHECRLKDRLIHACKRLAREGHVTIEKRGGKNWWMTTQSNKPIDTRWSTIINLPEKDRRGHPRLRGIRIDVDRTLLEVIRYIGHPCSLEEIMAAWGKLRTKRDAPLAADLSRIIIADERRKAKNERRLSRALKSNELVGSSKP